MLDGELAKGNPVIVRLKLRNGTPHFVVVVGKEGWDYLIRDPARKPDYGVYPLKNLTDHIEGAALLQGGAADVSTSAFGGPIAGGDSFARNSYNCHFNTHPG